MRTSPSALLVLALVLALGGCGDDDAAAATSAPEVVTPPSTDPPAVPDEGGGSGAVADPPAGAEAAVAGAGTAPPDVATATICERARACCDAFVAAIPSARRPLEGRACTEMERVLGPAEDGADEACEAAIGGWRQSLQLTGIAVPPACAD